MRDQRLDKRLEAEGMAKWCTDLSSGVSDDHRVFVLDAVKLEMKGDSQRERCIRALRDRVSENHLERGSARVYKGHSALMQGGGKIHSCKLPVYTHTEKRERITECTRVSQRVRS